MRLTFRTQFQRIHYFSIYSLLSRFSQIRFSFYTNWIPNYLSLKQILLIHNNTWLLRWYQKSWVATFDCCKDTKISTMDLHLRMYSSLRTYRCLEIANRSTNRTEIFLIICFQTGFVDDHRTYEGWSLPDRIDSARRVTTIFIAMSKVKWM